MDTVIGTIFGLAMMLLFILAVQYPTKTLDNLIGGLSNILFVVVTILCLCVLAIAMCIDLVTMPLRKLLNMY